MSNPSHSPHLILVEGKNDREVFHHLLTHHGIYKGVIECKACEGETRLLQEFAVRLKTGDLEPLGVVIDADDNLGARWDSLKYTLSQAGYTSIPQEPLADGTILQQEDNPVIGIWIMPDNKLPGMLEDFVSFLVPQGDPLWEQAKDCLNEIPEPQRKFKKHFAKAHIHTWLAWQEEPGTPLGSAINKRYLDADALHAKNLTDWVRRLFGLQKRDEQVANEPTS
jgi:hypothetical protein